MSAIITTKFRFKNANALIASLSGTGDDTYYVGIGRTQPWTSESNPPIPGDNYQQENDVKSNIIALKKIAPTNISRAIPRYNWIAGQTYYEYDDQDSTLSSKQFYCVTDELSVYKCIKAGPSGSTIKPTGTSSGIGNILSDGYQWKYMYTLSGNDVAKFLTASFVSVKTLDADDDTPQWDAQQAAIPGGIHRIKIINGGANYTTKPTVTITGDGTGCTVAAADITIAGGAITQILVTNPGFGYTIANVTISGGDGTGLSARAVVSPVKGHGADPVNELGAFYVMIDTPIVADDGSGDFIVDNDFRQIALIANPYEVDDTNGNLVGYWTTGQAYVVGNTVKYSGYTYVCAFNHTAGVFADDITSNYWVKSALSTASTLNALTTITYSNLVGSLSKDQTAVGQTSNAMGWVDSVNTGNNTIRFHQNSTTGFKFFQTGEQVTIGAASFTVVSVKSAEYDTLTGDVVYIENLTPVTRNLSQTEDIKLVLEL